MRVVSFIFLADFVILDCERDFKVSIILGRPLFVMGRALVDMEIRKIKFKQNNKQVIFHV